MQRCKLEDFMVDLKEWIGCKVAKNLSLIYFSIFCAEDSLKNEIFKHFIKGSFTY